MPFSDEDLKRLKEDLEPRLNWGSLTINIGMAKALLWRLKCAEEICEAIEIRHPEEDECGCSLCDLLQFWRQSKSK